MGKSVTSGDDDDVRVINSRPSSESSDSSEQSNGTCVVNLPKSTNLDGVVNINRPIVTLVFFTLFLDFCTFRTKIFFITISGRISFFTGKEEAKYSFEGQTKG